MGHSTMRLSRNCWLVLMLAVGFAASTAHSQEPSQPSSADEASSRDETLANEFDRELYIQSFDTVWKTIKDTHWDPEIVGSKWEAAREEFRPKMEAAKSTEEALAILESLLAELGQSHFGIVPRAAYAAIERQSARGGPGWSGMSLRWIEDQFVVTRVVEGSPAAAAGIKPGWSLGQSKRVHSGKVLTAQEILGDSRESAKHQVMRLETSLGLHSAALISGPIDEHLQLSFLDHHNQPTTVDLTLVKGPGEPSKLGNLPTVYVAFDYQKLDGKIGYIQFNAFLDPNRLIQLFQKALADEHNQRGLIIDLRGNIGGAIILAMGMSGWFVEERHSLGRMLMKNTPLNLTLNPRKPRFTQPVAVLIDECSISCAELLSGGLQELGVARVFGSRTAGLVLPSTVAKLPSGDGFQYAMAGFESSSGRELEKNGVEPDEIITLSRELLAQDPDPVLTAARRWLDQQSIQKKQ